MLKKIHLLISGNVQGVFYRANTKEKAEEFNLTGWVKNTINNKVELTAEGEENNLKKLISWCRDGTKNAVVKKVKVEWGSFKNEFDQFEILL